jgi:ABC-type branched-subunit amino acid transport system permease subunit
LRIATPKWAAESASLIPEGFVRPVWGGAFLTPKTRIRDTYPTIFSVVNEEMAKVTTQNIDTFTSNANNFEIASVR